MKGLESVRILQVSDFHGSQQAAEKARERARSINADVVVVVGDITNFGTIEEAERLLTSINEGSDLLTLFVPGNCDPPALLDFSPKDEKIMNIHARGYQAAGYTFIGVGGSRETPHRGTWIEFAEEDIRNIVSSLRTLSTGKWILVSHNPPSGVEAAKTAGGKDLGSPSIRSWIVEAKPLAVLCGHVHEARNVSIIDTIPVVNAGPARDGNCAVIEISGDKVYPRLDKL